MTEYQYSEKEWELFRIFGVDQVAGECAAPQIYRMMVETYFIGDKEFPNDAVESLRRCFRALMKFDVYRLTPEWDDLIQLEHEAEEDYDDPCPECGAQLRAKTLAEGGGVICTNPDCGYWFCF